MCPPPCAGCAVGHVWSTAVDAQAGIASLAATDDGFVLAGLTGETIDLGGGPLANPGGNSILVARVHADGTHLWSKVFGNSDYEGAESVAVDPFGNVVMTGFSSGEVDFGGGPVTGEAFLVKLDALGNHVFSRGFPSSDDLTRGNDLAVDAAGNTVVVGTFTGTIDLGAGSLASASDESVFVGRFDPAGSLLWSKVLETGSVPAPRVAIDPTGNIRIASAFSGTVDLGGASVSAPAGIFLATFTSDGVPLHNRVLTTDYDMMPGDLAIDASGDSVLTGVLGGTVNLGGGPIAGHGMFLAKYGPAEEYIWSQTFGGETSIGSWGLGLALDAVRNIHVVANSGGTDFGGGPLPKFDEIDDGDIAIAKFDPCGDHVWSQSFGAAASTLDGTIALGADGSLFVAGGYEYAGDVDFGGGPLGSANAGVYLAALQP